MFYSADFILKAIYRGVSLKLLIFGIVASGKTTLARKLSLKYNIPCYEGLYSMGISG